MSSQDQGNVGTLRAMSGFQPKVSCLVVTADRGRFLKRALLSYRAQTYPRKELVVVDDGREALDDLLADLPAGEVRYVRLEKGPGNTLGRLRNLSLDAATGDLMTQWDDDDWYHPDRLSLQVAALEEGKDSSVLTSALFHLDTPGYFQHPFRGLFRAGVPGSLLLRKDPLLRYPELSRGEDTAFLRSWRKRPQARLDVSCSYLHIRCYHGSNTWDYGHFVRRLTSTPRDAAGYVWHLHVRGDLFRHRRFRLSPKDGESFRLYLRDSRRAGLFPEEGPR
jgi:glycosyltransferase involved in cell wall biosynthesis